jgi:citrate synthase
MTQDLTFSTKISYHTQDGLYLRGEKLTSLIDEADFISTLFLSLVGRKPSLAENKVLNAVLISAIDHGIEPASGFTPRVVAASGNNALTAMASALLALGPYHGGAITNCMKLLIETNSLDEDKEAASIKIVKRFQENKQRVPGFGHPSYKEDDPRTTHLFEVARTAGLNPDYPNLAQIIEHTVEEIYQKKLVLNVDGAIASLLLAMGIDPKAGNAIFGLARVAGSISHILEEQHSGKWVRRLPKGSVTVDTD